MRLIDMPLAKFGGLVLIKAEMDAQGSFVLLSTLGETEVGGRIVSWIPADDDSMSTLPASISETRSLIESVWLTGFASTGSV